jgi:hypothetical protein
VDHFLQTHFGSIDFLPIEQLAGLFTNRHEKDQASIR